MIGSRTKCFASTSDDMASFQHFSKCARRLTDSSGWHVKKQFTKLLLGLLVRKWSFCFRDSGNEFAIVDIVTWTWPTDNGVPLSTNSLNVSTRSFYYYSLSAAFLTPFSILNPLYIVLLSVDIGMLYFNTASHSEIRFFISVTAFLQNSESSFVSLGSE